MKKHLEIFEAMTDEARQECWQEDINEGIRSVELYALNAMGIGLNKDEQSFIYELFHDFTVRHEGLGIKDYELEYEVPLIDYKYKLCNTCGFQIGVDEGCNWPSKKDLYFLGDKITNSICCEECQEEACIGIEDDEF